MNLTNTMERAVRSSPPWLRAFLRRVRALVSDPFAYRSYSQEGEDMILQRLFEGENSGLYVDVGAHHPRRFSNTCLLYRRGWTGINIEPSPSAIASFRAERPRDINIEAGISGREDVLTYFVMSDPALNSFDEQLTKLRVASTGYRVVDTRRVPVRRLDDVLRENLPAGERIDLLSIDVEGMDLAVLQSNDWEAFRPTVVMVESLDVPLEEIGTSATFVFMKCQGYQLLAKTPNTLFFKLPGPLRPTRESIGRSDCTAIE